MKLKFWGTRGSIPTPQPDRMRYGGDTSCVEMSCAGGERIICDAGTGIRRLGQELCRQGPAGEPVTIFLSHLHWDHIQGFPFFGPVYDPRFRLRIYGPLRMNSKMEFRLHVQMSDLFFPVELSSLEDRMEFIEVIEDPFTVGTVRITPRLLRHPLGCMGYRIDDGERVVVYATDNEHESGKLDEDVLSLARDADVLIYDAHFTDAEYPKFKGWGHSTWEEGIRVSKAAGVKRLVLYHHDPNHDDEFIDGVMAQAIREFPGTIAATRDLVLEV